MLRGRKTSWSESKERERSKSPQRQLNYGRGRQTDGNVNYIAPSGGMNNIHGGLSHLASGYPSSGQLPEPSLASNTDLGLQSTFPFGLAGARPLATPQVGSNHVFQQADLGNFAFTGHNQQPLDRTEAASYYTGLPQSFGREVATDVQAINQAYESFLPRSFLHANNHQQPQALMQGVNPGHFDNLNDNGNYGGFSLDQSSSASGHRENNLFPITGLPQPRAAPNFLPVQSSMDATDLAFPNGIQSLWRDPSYNPQSFDHAVSSRGVSLDFFPSAFQGSTPSILKADEGCPSLVHDELSAHPMVNSDSFASGNIPPIRTFNQSQFGSNSHTRFGDTSLGDSAFSSTFGQDSTASVFNQPQLGWNPYHRSGNTSLGTSSFSSNFGQNNTKSVLSFPSQTSTLTATAPTQIPETLVVSQPDESDEDLTEQNNRSTPAAPRTYHLDHQNSYSPAWAPSPSFSHTFYEREMLKELLRNFHAILPASTTEKRRMIHRYQPFDMYDRKYWYNRMQDVVEELAPGPEFRKLFVKLRSEAIRGMDRRNDKLAPTPDTQEHEKTGTKNSRTVPSSSKTKNSGHTFELSFEEGEEEDTIHVWNSESQQQNGHEEVTSSPTLVRGTTHESAHSFASTTRD
ncbi:MAG: hypothetical protein M1831_002551 [Alyxoria varia]|nr:MAG: hypothetical protein M1831_002551 [Alyxoria varia]